MIRWTLLFLTIAIVAAILGFGNVVVGTVVEVARMQFFFFTALFLISLVAGSLFSRRDNNGTTP